MTTPAQPTEREMERARELFDTARNKWGVEAIPIIAQALARARAEERERCDEIVGRHIDAWMRQGDDKSRFAAQAMVGISNAIRSEEPANG